MSAILLGEWGFLDNLDDTSGNGIVPSVNFTPNYIDGPTPGSRAIRFTGAGQQINYGRTGLEPPAEAGGIITMAWVKLFSSHTGYTDIVHKTRAFDSTRHSIDVSQNTAFFMSRWRDQTNFAEISSRNLSDFGWHHLCNVDSDDRYAWYWDGIPLTSVPRTGTAPVSWEPYPWVSGWNVDMNSTDSSANVAFTGVRLFSGTMSDLDVATWMNTDILPGRSGKPKVWSGAAWTKHQAKVWNGTSWDDASMAGHDGTEWVTTK